MKKLARFLRKHGFELALWTFVFVYAGPKLLPQLSALSGLGGTVGAAPAFAATTLDGDVLTAEDLRGNVVVVNFWATWCRPCRLEMPVLQELWEERGSEGVVVLGLNTEVLAEGRVREFVAERGITYPISLQGRQLERAFGGAPQIPTTLIIDRRGVIRHRVVGYFLSPALNAAVGRLLAEPEEAEGVEAAETR